MISGLIIPRHNRSRPVALGGLLLASFSFVAGLSHAVDLAPVSIWTPSNNVAYYPAGWWSLQVPVTYGITNQGQSGILWWWHDRVCVSTNSSTDGIVSCQDTFEYWGSNPLLSGGSYWRTISVALPQQSGTYWLIAQANADGGIIEETGTNNTLVSASPVTLTYQVVPPDLVPLYVAAASNHVESTPPSPQIPTVPVVYAVTNQGLGVAAGWWSDLVCVSTNDTTNGIISVQSFGEEWSSGGLPSGGVYWRTNLVSLPHENGTYWLFFEANGPNAGLSLYEENHTNNSTAAGVPVTLTYRVVPPDLAALDLSFTNDHVMSFPPWPGPPQVSVVYAVTNQGLGLAVDTWEDRLSVSTNDTTDGIISWQCCREGVAGWTTWSPPVPPGAVYWRTNLVTLPQETGTYWFFFAANADNGLYEENLSNNSLAATGSVTVVSADLAALSIAAASNHVEFFPSSPEFPTVPVVYGVTNQGLGIATGSWYDLVGVSTNNTPDGIVTTQGFEQWNSVALAPGDAYWRTNLVTLPQRNGNYWLILQAGPPGQPFNNLHEDNLSNNIMVASIPITVTYQVVPPDLALLSITATSNTVASFPSRPQSPTVPVVYAVTNQGLAAASGYWYDQLSISTNSTPEGIISSQRFLENWSWSPLEVAGVYWRTNLASLPRQSGRYWLVMRANTSTYDGYPPPFWFPPLYEDNLSNNTAVAATPVTLIYQVTPPDLTPLRVAAMTNSVICLPPSPQSPTVAVVYAVTNQGSGVASGQWWDQVSLSTNGSADGIISSQIFYETWNSSPLASGGVYWRTNPVSLPAQNGTYWLILQVNGCQNVYEENYANNLMTAAVPVSVTYEVIPPDLMPVALQAPTGITGPPGAGVTVIWGVTNQGIAPATGGWSDKLYLSTNAVLDPNAVLAGIFEETNSVAVGDTYWRTNTVRLPATQSRIYYLVLSVDAANELYEINESNNILAVAITFNVTSIGVHLSALTDGGRLVLDWTGPYVLQSATNISGPFLDLSAATSPFTNSLQLEAKRFFRLRSTGMK